MANTIKGAYWYGKQHVIVYENDEEGLYVVKTVGAKVNKLAVEIYDRNKIKFVNK